MSKKIMFAITLLLSGRAMTLAFIHRVGGNMPGDPPAAWLMPLIGDAIIGITGLFIAYLILKKVGLWAWTAIVVWNALAIWDALAAYTIHLTNPWPEFFMIQMAGSSMFFMASAMHLVVLLLSCSKEVRKQMLG
ncbi:MAG: hypothetical protein ACRBF0_23090 [Calditrichia bacterium]